MTLKQILPCVFLAALLLVTYDTTAQPSTLEIEITGLRNDKGHVLISLYKNEEGFPDNPTRALQKQSVTPKGNKALVKFSSVPNGVYAVAVMHDENDNMKMDKNFLGIPKEGFGFSNNASRLTGPPSFKEASFEHVKSEVLQIKMKY